MNKSESIKELAAALAKAQGTIRAAEKDAENPFFGSRYATLAAIWDACREALSSNGIAVAQTPARTEKGVTVTTLLMHASGEWLSGDLELPLQKSDAQGIGSAISYARRYALASFVGVAPEDDDGNAAARPGEQPKQQAKKPAAKKSEGNGDTLQYQEEMEKWRDYLPTLKNAIDHTNAVANLQELHEPAKGQQRKLLAAQAKKLGLTWDDENRCFVDAAKEEAVA